MTIKVNGTKFDSVSKTVSNQTAIDEYEKEQKLI